MRWGARSTALPPRPADSAAGGSPWCCPAPATRAPRAVAARVAAGFDGSHPPIRTAVAVWHNGDHGADVLARARLALDAAATIAD